MLVASFRLAPEAVALAETLDANPGIEVQAERVASHATVWTMPCLWVTADDFDAVDESLAADPSIDAVIGSTAFGDEKYYQIDWADAVDERIDAYVDTDGSILNARGSHEGWYVRIRFVHRAQFQAFRDELRERSHAFELRAIAEPEETRQPVVDLTPDQREALRAARERGYFEVPRQVTLRELADGLDTSHQNLSRLLRRGSAKLVDKSLGPQRPVDGP